MLFTVGVGIEISEREVNIVCLKKTVGGYKLAAAEKGVLAEEKPLRAKTEDISSFINEFIKSRRISGADLFICVPSGRAIFREIEFPLVVRENLRTTLAYEMEKYLPLPAEEVYFDFQVTREDRERQVITVALAAVKKTDLEPYLEVAAHLRIPPSGLTLRTAGAAGSFLGSAPSADPVHLVALPGKEGLEVAVVRNRALIYGKHLAPEPGTAPADAWSRAVSTLGERFSDGGKPVSVAIHALPEEGRDLDGLVQGDAVSFSGVVPPAADLPASDYIPAFGTAVQALGESPVALNLMPEDLRKQPNKLPYHLLYALAGMLFLSFVLWGGSHVYRRHAYLEYLDNRLSAVQKEARAVERIHSDIRELEDRVRQLRSLRPGNTYVVNVLLELTQRVPVSAWVRDLKIDENEIHIYGIADSASDVIPLLEESPMFYGAEFLSTIRKTRDNEEMFRIGLKFRQAGS